MRVGCPAAPNSLSEASAYALADHQLSVVAPSTSRVPTWKCIGQVGRHEDGVDTSLVVEPPPSDRADPRYLEGHEPTLARSLQSKVAPPE